MNHNTNGPSKYVKLPIPIEAIQYDGQNDDEILEFACGKAKVEIDHDPNSGQVVRKSLVIYTPEGKMLCRNNAYVVRGNHNDVWSVRGDIFEATYRLV